PSPSGSNTSEKTPITPASGSTRNTANPHPTEGHGEPCAADEIASAALGPPSRSSSPRASTEDHTASNGAKAPSASIGARNVNVTPSRTSPSTRAPGAATTRSCASTSPSTRELGPSATEPPTLTTAPLTWPVTSIRPSSTTTSPRTTPATIAVPWRTTTSPTSWPRRTWTSPDRTIWSRGSAVPCWVWPRAATGTASHTPIRRSASPVRPRCIAEHPTGGARPAPGPCRAFAVRWDGEHGWVLPRRPSVVRGHVRGAHRGAGAGVARDRRRSAQPDPGADGLGQDPCGVPVGARPRDDGSAPAHRSPMSRPLYLAVASAGGRHREEPADAAGRHRLGG